MDFWNFIHGFKFVELVEAKLKLKKKIGTR